MSAEPHTREPRPLVPKFKCPACGGYRSHVVRGDPRQDAYRRRRECDDCEHRFNTTERVEKSSDRNI